MRELAPTELAEVACNTEMTDNADILKSAAVTIEVGSKSFSLASKFFDEETYKSAILLYAWCRYCDDQIDEVIDHQTKMARLDRLFIHTKAAFARDKAPGPIFLGLQTIARQHSFSKNHALELLEGMAMDLRGESYTSLSQMEVYCYRVAGVVGLMMCQIMGVKDSRAYQHASSLGSAMQMTNIARDILDDALMGRCYLPEEWLKSAGLNRQNHVMLEHRSALAQVVSKLLDEAESRYEFGNAGIKYLPFRAALAISAASAIYREIGKKILKLQTHAWDQRVVVPLPRKIVICLSAFARLLLQRTLRKSGD